MTVMNLCFLRKYMTGCRAIVTNTLKIAGASVIMGVFAYLVCSPLSAMLSVRKGGLIAIILAAAVYALLVVLFKIITIKEIKSVLRKGKNEI